MRHILTAASLVLSGPAAAATLVDTGTPPASELTWALNASQSLAARFTLNAASTIESVLGHLEGNSDGSIITIGLHSDGRQVPGALLYSANFTALPSRSFQGVSSQSWAVSAGTYWVSFASVGFNGMGQYAPS